MNYNSLKKDLLIAELEKRDSELKRLSLVESDLKICQTAVNEQSNAFTEATRIKEEYDNDEIVNKKEIAESEQKYADLQKQYTVEINKLSEQYALREAQIVKNTKKQVEYYQNQMNEQNNVIVDLFELIDDGVKSKAFVYSKYKNMFFKEVQIEEESKE